MQPSSSQQNSQTGNTGDHERDGNTSYDQGGTHNTGQRQKLGITNMNYHSMPNYSMNIGISIGMMTMWNEMVGKKLNSSRDACLNEGVMSRFIHFFSFYLPNRDSGPVRPLIDTSAWRSHVITSTLRILASILCATPHSHTQFTMRNLYVYLHFKYLRSSSHSMYPSIELTLIYTETIA